MKHVHLALFLLAATACKSPNQTKTSHVQDYYGPGYNAAQMDSSFVQAGNWRVSQPFNISLNGASFEVSPDSFGILKVQLPNEYRAACQALGGDPCLSSYAVREGHYYLGDSVSGEPLYGIRAFPVDQNHRPGPHGFNRPVPAQNGYSETDTYGSRELDQFLRAGFGFANTTDPEPIFAITSYGWPAREMTLAGLTEIANLRFENGISHVGMYIGDGETRNSPHHFGQLGFGNVGEVPGYAKAINITVLECLDCGSTQANINRNLVTTLHLMNAGNNVNFPDDYKFDVLTTINMREAFAYYRGWLEGFAAKNPQLSYSSYWVRPTNDYSGSFNASDVPKYKNWPFHKIINDTDVRNPYRPYCGDHMTLVLNIGLNLVQTEQGYKDVYGPAIGKELFSIAQVMWKSAVEKNQSWYYTGFKDFNTDGKDNGVKRFDKVPNFPRIDEFKPLWQLPGDNGANLDILGTCGSAGLYACTGPGGVQEGLLSQEGSQAQYMAIPPANTADLVNQFIKQYANWMQVGPVIPSVLLLGLTPILVDRTKLPVANVMGLLFGPIQSIFKHHALYKGYASANYQQILQSHVALMKGMMAQHPQLSSHVATIESVVLGPLLAEDAIQALDTAARVLREANPANLEDAIRNLFLQDIKGVLTVAQQLSQAIVQVSNADLTAIEVQAVAYYQPPASLHRVINGVFPSNPNVKFRTVATVLPGNLIARQNSEEYFIDPEPAMDNVLPDNHHLIGPLLERDLASQHQPDTGATPFFVPHRIKTN